MRALVLLLTIIFAVGTANGQDKTTCSCSGIPGGPIAQLDHYDPIIAGVVERIIDDPNDDHWLDVDVRVLRSFGNTRFRPLEITRVEVLTGCGFGCGYCWFEENEPFIIYAETVDWRERPFVNFCSRTERLEDAREDLEAFNSLDLLEPKSNTRCGGTDNLAAVQSILVVLLFAGPFRRRRKTPSSEHECCGPDGESW